jgi:hypothetical protein
MQPTIDNTEYFTFSGKNKLIKEYKLIKDLTINVLEKLDIPIDINLVVPHDKKITLGAYANIRVVGKITVEGSIYSNMAGRITIVNSFNVSNKVNKYGQITGISYEFEINNANLTINDSKIFDNYHTLYIKDQGILNVTDVINLSYSDKIYISDGGKLNIAGTINVTNDSQIDISPTGIIEILSGGKLNIINNVAARYGGNITGNGKIQGEGAINIKYIDSFNVKDFIKGSIENIVPIFEVTKEINLNNCDITGRINIKDNGKINIGSNITGTREIHIIDSETFKLDNYITGETNSFKFVFDVTKEILIRDVKNITNNVDILETGIIKILKGGKINLTGTIAGKGKIYIELYDTLKFGEYIYGGTLNDSITIVLQVKGIIDVQENININANTTIELSNDSKINVQDQFTLNVSGAINIKATDYTGNIDAIDSGRITGSGQINIIDSETFQLNKYIIGDVNIDTVFRVNKEINFAGKITLANTINVSSKGRLNINKGGEITVSGQGAILVSEGRIDVDGTIIVLDTGKISVSSAGQININKGGEINVSGQGKINVSGENETNVLSKLTINDGGKIVVSSTGNIIDECEIVGKGQFCIRDSNTFLVSDHITGKAVIVPIFEVNQPINIKSNCIVANTVYVNAIINVSDSVNLNIEGKGKMVVSSKGNINGPGKINIINSNSFIIKDYITGTVNIVPIFEVTENIKINNNINLVNTIIISGSGKCIIKDKCKIDGTGKIFIRDSTTFIVGDYIEGTFDIEPIFQVTKDVNISDKTINNVINISGTGQMIVLGKMTINKAINISDSGKIVVSGNVNGEGNINIINSETLIFDNYIIGNEKIENEIIFKFIPRTDNKPMIVASNNAIDVYKKIVVDSVINVSCTLNIYGDLEINGTYKTIFNGGINVKGTNQNKTGKLTVRGNLNCNNGLNVLQYGYMVVYGKATVQTNPLDVSGGKIDVSGQLIVSEIKADVVGGINISDGELNVNSGGNVTVTGKPLYIYGGILNVCGGNLSCNWKCILGNAEIQGENQCKINVTDGTMKVTELLNIINGTLEVYPNATLHSNGRTTVNTNGKLDVNGIFNCMILEILGIMTIRSKKTVVINANYETTIRNGGVLNLNDVTLTISKLDVSNNGNINVISGEFKIIDLTMSNKSKINVSGGSMNVSGTDFDVFDSEINIISDGILYVKNSRLNLSGTMKIDGSKSDGSYGNAKVVIDSVQINIKKFGKIILSGKNNVDGNPFIDLSTQANCTITKGLFASIENKDNMYFEGEIKTCFPFDAIVTTPSGKKRCGDLIVGDYVMVDHKGTFEPILFFGHREDKETLFTELILVNGKKMSATPQHYIYIYNNRKKKMVHIKDIVIGDYVKYYGKRIKVAETKIVTKRGFVSPHTKSHDIVIDGVQASCYAVEEFIIINNIAVNVVDALGITIPLQLSEMIRNYV